MKRFQQNSLPDPREVKPEILLKSDYYTEGPVADHEGNVFFTDLLGQSIYQFRQDKQLLWGHCKRPNGQALLKNGEHLVCDSLEPGIVHFDTQGSILAVLAKGNIEDLPVRCPNDIVVDHEHGFYFTDSVRHTGAVFFVGFDGFRKVVASNIDYANGIVMTPDRRHLLVAESYQNRILMIKLEAPGIARRATEVFAILPFHARNRDTGNLPDGLALDVEERLWVAHYGMQAVQVLSPSGALLVTYDTGIPLTSNVCFAGNDLLVTGGEAEPGPGYISRLKVGITGSEL